MDFFVCMSFPTQCWQKKKIIIINKHSLFSRAHQNKMEKNVPCTPQGTISSAAPVVHAW